MKNINKFFILVLLLIVLGESWFLIGNKLKSSPQMAEYQKLKSEPVPAVLSNSAIVSERERWSKIIDAVGPEQAYSDFKSEYMNENFGKQHLAAHIMGTLLYQKEGIAGQAVCDSTFSFGCYHSFFSKALTDKGLSIIPKLNQVCLDKFGPLGSGCQHGIGHGIMDYFGPSHLLAALNACQPTTTPSPIAGCTSGVFMEYNVPVIISETDAVAESRPINPQKPYDPCPQLPESFQESCYYSIGQWWDQTDVYRGKWKEQGLLCKNIPNATHMETCYLGIGNVAAPDNGFDPDKAIAACKEMPDAKAIVICQAGASWSFAANPQFKPLAIKMCWQLDKNDTAECLRRGNLLNPSNQ